MKSSQWNTLGTTFIILFAFLMFMAVVWNSNCSLLASTIISGSYDAATASTYTACVVKAQSYAIPGIISFFSAIAFWICARLEKK